MRTTLRTVLVTLATALGGAVANAPAAAQAPAAPPPIAAFFKKPAVRQPRLSPSGRYLAIQAVGANDRALLAVIDLQAMAPPKIVAGFQDVDIVSHDWVSEDRLVFRAGTAPDGKTVIFSTGVWAVNRDATGYRQLIDSVSRHLSNETTRPGERRLDINHHFAGVVPGDSNEIFVARYPLWRGDSDAPGEQMSRLDTVTGRLRNLSEGLPDYVYDWTMDWRGEPRAVSAASNGRNRHYLREADGRWKLWKEDDAYTGGTFKPYWFGPDGQTLVLDGWQGFEAVFQLDPKTQQREAEPLITFKGYDYQGELLFDPDARRLLGLRHETEAPGTVWLDATMKALQADIDAKLPGSVNQIECRRCLNATHLVVTALSDQHPPIYYTYKPANKQLQPLSSQRPDIRVQDMGQRDYHRIKARDGLELPVLVTQPAGGVGKQARPVVVLVHGGPYLRGTHWAWEPDAQFLASRGYLVLEPEFRGSTGYGFRHFQAGWKQWGLAMQDDIADTLAWAVKQGWADPKRACIAGASYGGYAAMMGAVTQGDLFKCAINWVGVTDIGLMSSIQWNGISEEWQRYGMKRLVADPDTDAEQMKKTSPLQRAKEIRMPLLMAYGGSDYRVPMQHGTDMKAALRPDQDVEWVVYPDEGHGWFDLKTHEDFWGRVERFLARNIGATAPK